MKPSDDAMNINILLPAKEAFSTANAGAVATVVDDLVTKSSRDDDVRVIGNDVDMPFPNVNFCSLKPKLAWFYGNNTGLLIAYLNQMKNYRVPDLIEIHGRCHVAAQIMKKRPDIPVSLYLHNNHAP